MGPGSGWAASGAGPSGPGVGRQTTSSKADGVTTSGGGSSIGWSTRDYTLQETASLKASFADSDGEEQCSIAEFTSTQLEELKGSAVYDVDD